MSAKQRVDVALFEKNFAPSREKAARMVLAGCVYYNGQKVDKPSFQIETSRLEKIEVRTKAFVFVSRGGLKLEKAFKSFDLSVQDKICVDIGASTGGFTHCMLLRGAKKVYAIDVGYGQLDWRMRSDERVIVMERTNARNLESSWFSEPLEFGSMDVSFISIRLILKPLYDCLASNAYFVALIKPQFEAGRDKVGKKGVVRDSKTHVEVIVNMISFARSLHYAICGLDYSPITGPKGNIEFLLLLQKSDQNAWEAEEDLSKAQEIAQCAYDFHQK